MATGIAQPRPGADPRVRDAAATLGLVGVLAGLYWLAGFEALGFDRPAPLSALAAWLPETLPAAVIVGGSWLLSLGAGAVLARWARRRPFGSLEDAVLEGFVGAVLLDVALLFLLGPLGWFRGPVLVAAQLGVVVSLRWAGRPFEPGAPARPRIGRVTPLAVLVTVAWAGPVVLGLTSPVVPFMDILPNHVAPVEHLRTFGGFAEMPISPSPIYGPSRALVGYTALLGTISTTTALPAGAAIAASILPGLVLVGLSIRRLAVRLAGPTVGSWILVTFTLAASFARLADARATVIVLPLALWALAKVADRLDGRAGEGPVDALRLGAALGAAVLVHPVIGGLAIVTVGLLAVLRPAFAAHGIPAVGVASCLALPQAAAMLGLGLPPAAALVALPLAGLLGLGLVRAASLCQALAQLGRALGFIGLVLVVFSVEPLGNAVLAASGYLVGSSPFLAALAVVGIGQLRRAPSGVILGAAAVVGFATAVIGEAVPGEGVDLALAGLHFELPKAIQFWLPVVAAIPAAGAIATLEHAPRLGVTARAALLGAVILGIALPLRIEAVDRIHLGEHRISETLATQLGYAGEGYFSGFPDTRRVIDGPRRELVEALRVEIDAGRLTGDTEVLHVAASFQQWLATPLGVFLGVIETDVVPEPERSIHTLGGRLEPLSATDGLLDGGRFTYVVLEPHGDLPLDLRERILRAGYDSIFANVQGEVFRSADGR